DAIQNPAKGPGTRTERDIDVHALAFERPRGLFFLIGLCAALSLPARAAQGPEPGPLLRLSARLGAAGPAPAPAAPAAALTAPIPAAPAGTPVHAAGDGVIESMGREPRFGRMLRIRHDGEIETAYSHLARFAPGLKVGSVVSAGEVIGTVGHSGWATGPHLDYEVIVDGRSVDPASLKNRPALR